MSAYSASYLQNSDKAWKYEGNISNETYDVYAPNYPHTSGQDENYLFELSAKNFTNRSYFFINQPYDNQNWQFNDNINVCDSIYNNTGISAFNFQVAIYIMYILIFLVALIGNGIVFFIVQSSPRMRTVTNFFIANLAVGDMLMSVFCVPFSFISLFVLQYWPFGGTICRLVNYSQVVSVLVSAYTLVAISGDRYIAIMWPLRPRITKRFAKCLITVVWVIALITALPILIFSTLNQPAQWHEHCDKFICAEDWPSELQNYYYTMALMTSQFLVPLLVLIFTYTRIAVVVWGKRPPGEAENCRDQRMAKSKRKMIKMMVTVVIVFTICWLPFNIFMLITPESSWDLLPYFWFAFHWLAMSHSCYNPIIYCYMNARFRSGFIQVLHRIPGCQRICCCKSQTQRSTRNVGSSVALAGIDEVSQLHRVNTCTTYISTRRKTNISSQQVQCTETALLR